MAVTMITVGVLASTAVLGWTMWQAFQWIEKPRRVRQVLFFLGALYVIGAVNGIWLVATKQAPVWSLLFLPIAVGAARLYLRSAAKIQIPPNG